MGQVNNLRSQKRPSANKKQANALAHAIREVYVSPSLAHFRGQSLEVGGESLAVSSIADVRLIACKPPLKGPLLLATAGALLVATGAMMGAQGIGVAISAIPWLLFGWRGVTRRRSRMVLAIAARDGRIRELYSSNPESLEQMAHELRESISQAQIA